jgi:hypothetical protein
MQIFLPLLAWYFEQIYYLYIYTPCWDMTKSVESDGSGHCHACWRQSSITCGCLSQVTAALLLVVLI